MLCMVIYIIIQLHIILYMGSVQYNTIQVPNPKRSSMFRLGWISCTKGPSFQHPKKSTSPNVQPNSMSKTYLKNYVKEATSGSFVHVLFPDFVMFLQLLGSNSSSLRILGHSDQNSPTKIVLEKFGGPTNLPSTLMAKFYTIYLASAQPPPSCSFARHLVGKMAIFCSFAHH